ncbi:phage tail protein [Siminovitchia sp. 179-K 8D1 HS]|uniref:DUF7359 domain-containing protein n=1 Tax=Siminovitchia sp. 179-K 8D1 HS TaxID=3142385 RepID=UPI0039A38A95
MSFIRQNLKPQKLELSLAKPDRTVIGKLLHIKNERLKFKHGEVNELSFTLPYEVVMRSKLVRNPHIDKIKEKFFIKMKLGSNEEWFIITKLSKKADNTDDMDIQCFSLGYQLSYQRMIDYVGKSLNCLQVLTDCLKGTTWKIGYINPEFNLKHRQFDVSSKSKLEFLYEIAETFEGVVRFDTISNKINIYKEEEISQHKGFWISEGRYLENIESSIDADEIVTRLFVKGSEGLTINSVNPTGQAYVDDFSYFLSPFEMDENGNVVSHSDFMSDDLCIALIKYNKMASSLKGEFANLLNEKKEIQQKKTKEENKLNELNHELTIILDRLDIAKKLGNDTSQIISERNSKQNEIKNQKQVIESIKKELENIDKKIEALKHQLNIETHLSDKLMNELTNFIQVFEWTDDNQIDPNDLYEEGMKHLKTVNSPPVNMKVGIVNFLEMVTESHNWDRLNVGDIVKIKHKKLNIWVTAKIIEIEFDFENATIDLSISNIKELETTKNKIKRAFYTIDQVNTDYNSRKTDWIKVTQNYNLRNDRIKETPVNPSGLTVSHEENDDGSASLIMNWSYPNYVETEKNVHNIDGFIVYLYSDVDDTPYIFGSRMANETMIPELHYSTRSYTFPSVPGNRYYTLGVRAYRRVDPDINSDQIIFSDIVSLDKPYLPTTKINFKGKVNGSSYTVASEAPKKPENGDIWVNTQDAKVYVRDGDNWKVDNSLKDSKDYTDKIIGITEEEIRREVEDALKEVDEAMERVNSEVDRIENEVVPRINETLKDIDNRMEFVDSEMERIENEVVPNVERAIRETYIPRQDTPPEEIGSGLWWDTSVEPERLMKYDSLTGKWVPVGPTQEELDEIVKEVEDALKEVDEAKERVNSEMDRIENEVIPEVERAIKETYIPKQETPPDPEEYKLWWDTSKEPPRFMQYDENKKEWVPVAPTEDEINQLMDDIRNSITEGYQEYTQEEIEAIRQAIIDDLNSRIGNVNAKIDNLNSIANNLRDRADSTDELLSRHNGKINTIETNFNELEGRFSATLTDIQKIDNTVQGHTATLTAHAKELNAKLDSLKYERDMEGVLNRVESNETDLRLVAEGLELRVTKDEFNALEIGGRNLLKDSNNFTTLGKYQGAQYTYKTGISVPEWNATDATEIHVTGGTSAVKLTKQTGNRTIIGSNYVHSVWIKNIGTTVVRISNNLGMTEEVLPNESKRVIIFGVGKEGQNEQFNFNAKNINDNLDFIAWRMQIEQGTKVSNWQEAPEDIDYEITAVRDRVSTTETTLTAHAGLIEAKAEKSEVYTKTEVNTALGKKVDTTVYNNKVGELTTSINNITARVSNTETNIDALTGNMTSALNQIANLDIKANQIDLRVSEVRAEFDNLEIGGRNLNRDSNNFSRSVLAAYDGSTLTVTENVSVSEWGATDATKIYATSGSQTSLLKAYKTITNTTSTVEGELYTVSIYVKNNRDVSMSVRINGIEGTPIETIKPNEAKRVTATGKRTSLELQLQFRANANGYYLDCTVWRAQVEKGNRATDWTPAPEDADARITSAETSISTLAGQISSKAEVSTVNALGTRITTAEQNINAHTGEINQRVKTTDYNGNTISSLINQTATTVGINATKINFGGVAEFLPFSKNFHKATTIANGTAGKWYRIASNAGDRAHGKFMLKDTTSGQHNTAVFEAGINFNRNPYINLTSFGLYGARSFTKARILYNTTYDTVYLDIYVLNNARDQKLEYWITDNIQDSGWVGVNWTVASVPSGYKSFERDLNEESVTQGTVDKWKYGNTTLINGGEIYTSSITANKLNINEIFGNSAVIAKIRSDTVLTTNLDATKITTGTLNAANVSIVNLSASSILSGTLDAGKVNVTNLNASNIATGTLNAGRIGAQSITAAKLNITEIFGNSAVIAKIQSDSVKTATLDATKITTGTLNAAQVSVVNISATNITGGTLDASKVNVRNLNATYITTGTLDALKVSVKNLSASSILSGTLDANKVNVANLNASNIKSGTLTAIDISGVNIYGSKFASSDKLTNLEIVGGNIKLTQSNNNYINIRPDGLFGYNANGTTRFQADSLLVTSRALGTTTANVYLAAQTGKEARVVDMKDVPSDGEVGSYSYLNMRAAGFYGNFIETNGGTAGVNLYARPRNGGEFRITGANTTDVYYPLRAGVIYGSAFVTTTQSAWIGTDNYLHVVAKGTVEGSSNPVYRPLRAGNIFGTAFITSTTNAYIGADEELRVVNKGLSGIYRDLRAQNIYAQGKFTAPNNGVFESASGYVVLRAGGTNGITYLQSNQHVRATKLGQTGSYINIQAADFIPSSSEKWKTDIEKYEGSALNLFRQSTIYRYLKHGSTEYEYGFITERETPKEIIRGEGISSYSHNSLNTKAIQELDTKVYKIEDEINWLKLENQYLKQKIQQLENK